jgi:hypothetical protein
VTDPADFLSRWSRRKRKAATSAPGQEVEKASEVARESKLYGNADAISGEPGKKQELSGTAKTKPEEPVFDISQLPPIESITAETDIRAFLSAGVPAAIRQAALRRAWSADPKIRDFIEIAENQMDFNAPAEILGFDFSAPSGDIKRMAADIYGKLPASESEANAQPATTPAHEAVPAEFPTERSIASHHNVNGTFSRSENGEGATQNAINLPNEVVSQRVVVRQEELHIATQKNDAAQESRTQSRKPPHGRALPK